MNFGISTISVMHKHTTCLIIKESPRQTHPAHATTTHSRAYLNLAPDDSNATLKSAPLESSIGWGTLHIYSKKNIYI